MSKDERRRYERHIRAEVVRINGVLFEFYRHKGRWHVRVLEEGDADVGDRKGLTTIPENPRS